jgi:hypothetical protein
MMTPQTVEMSTVPAGRQATSLLDHRANAYSQHGEDGVIRRIFDVIGTTNRTCCEFGAWDGVHLSNTRALILDGWSAVLIEAEEQRHAELRTLYADRPDVQCVRATIDEDSNTLRDVLDRNEAPVEFDFVSIDIDGLDYQVFSSMRVSARVVCVEVASMLDPDQTTLLPASLASQNIGQSLGCFRLLAERMGYKLVGYTGNAFFVKRDAAGADALPAVAPADAYRSLLGRLDVTARQYLYAMNLGLLPPYRRFHNPYLTTVGLRLSREETLSALARGSRIRAAAAAGGALSAMRGLLSPVS